MSRPVFVRKLTKAEQAQITHLILYLDECEVHLHPTLTKVWTLKGTRPVVPAAGNNQRLCLYGVFNYKTGQVHYMSHPKKNSRRFAQFLSQLLSANANRFLVLVLDNASYHRTAEILDILTQHEEHVFVVWLPKYSPELNPIEGLWLDGKYFTTLGNSYEETYWCKSSIVGWHDLV